MTPDTTKNAPAAPGTALTWLPLAAAALILGISERTAQRRAKAGKIPARKVKRKDGEAWEIGLGADIVPTGADTVLSAKGPEVPTFDGRVPTGADTDFTEHLKAENAFLRGQIETIQREHALAMAAMREALRVLPKALPAPENSGAATDTPKPPKAPKNGAQATKTGALSWADVAASLDEV